MNKWRDFECFGYMMETAAFRFATSMKRNPHCYTLRDSWVNGEDFEWAVQYIRDNGYSGYFWGKQYIYINVNEFRYWTMGDPVKDTILINRKPHRKGSEYDSISRDYDKLFNDKASLAENREVFSLIGDMKNLAVLDVGCGTGLTLEHGNPDCDKYLGIDPSLGMLGRFYWKWPRHRTRHTSLSELYSFIRYDLLLCLFGTASYISDSEAERLPSLVKPGGRILAMTYSEDYEPVTHRKTGVDAPFFRDGRLDNILPGSRQYRIGGHELYDWRKA